MLTGRGLEWNDWRLAQSKVTYIGSVRVYTLNLPGAGNSPIKMTRVLVVPFRG